MKTKCPLPKRFSGTKRVSGILLGLLALALAAASVAGAAPFAYVSNLGSNSVSVIDGATNQVIVTVAVGDQPAGVAVNADGTRVYVANSNLFGAGVPSLSIIDTSTIGTTNTLVVTPVSGVGSAPFGVAINKDGTKVYVANMGNATVAVISTATNSVIGTIATGKTLSGFIAVNPVNGRVYVTDANDLNGGHVIAIDDTGTSPALTSVSVGSVGSSPQGVGVHPSGAFVYVANTDGTVSVLDTTKIGTLDNPVINTVQIGSVDLGMPVGIAVSPTENAVYVTNQGEETVEIISALPPNGPIATVRVGIDPYGVAIDPTGAFVFVGNYGAGSVSVIAANNVATVTVSPSLVFGSFVGGAPPTPSPSPSCDPTITEPYAKLKVALKKNALQARAAALRELEKAKAKVGGNDKRIVRAQKEFDAGAAALCIGHYRRAAHEYWEAYEIAYRVLWHDKHYRR